MIDTRNNPTWSLEKLCVLMAILVAIAGTAQWVSGQLAEGYFANSETRGGHDIPLTCLTAAVILTGLSLVVWVDLHHADRMPTWAGVGMFAALMLGVPFSAYADQEGRAILGIASAGLCIFATGAILVHLNLRLRYALPILLCFALPALGEFVSLAYVPASWMHNTPGPVMAQVLQVIPAAGSLAASFLIACCIRRRAFRPDPTEYLDMVGI